MDDEYEISTDPARLDFDVVHGYLATESYWAKGIARDRVERAAANSLCFGAYHRGAQVGYARVVTDRTMFCWLADVFVLPAHRGRGVGRRLMDAVHAHPELATVRRMMLATADAHTLYAGYGYGPVRADVLMEKTVGIPAAALQAVSATTAATARPANEPV